MKNFLKSSNKRRPLPSKLRPALKRYCWFRLTKSRPDLKASERERRLLRKKQWRSRKKRGNFKPGKKSTSRPGKKSRRPGLPGGIPKRREALNLRRGCYQSQNITSKRFWILCIQNKTVLSSRKRTMFFNPDNNF